MKISESNLSVLLGVALSTVATPTVANDVSTFEDLFIKGSIIADFRLRYESVEQTGVSEDAEAFTLRGRLGFETAEAYGLSAIAELETIHHLGGTTFNDTLNGKGNYPVVADPESTQLNRLQLRYRFENLVDATIGRQRIKLDNDRFIGNVGFRQNEQTFDAARIDVSPMENLTARYIYLAQVNRVFGEDSAVGRFDLEGHVANVSYDLGPVSAVGYGYLIENEDVAALSSATYGLRLHGKTPVGPVELGYVAEVAQQSDYGNNTASFEHLYYNLGASAGWSGLTIGAAYEVLEGNGTTAFQTPYATGHKFQGMADVFLTTPTNGIQDMSVTAKYVLQSLGWADKVSAFATYHDFSAETGSADYGTEIDVGVAATFDYGFGLEAKYANYNAVGFATDRNKLWLSATYSY
jgi:hypothetical protein